MAFRFLRCIRALEPNALDRVQRGNFLEARLVRPAYDRPAWRQMARDGRRI